MSNIIDFREKQNGTKKYSLDRDDLLILVTSRRPCRAVFGKHVKGGRWSIVELAKLDEDKLYEIYLECKNAVFE